MRSSNAIFRRCLLGVPLLVIQRVPCPSERVPSGAAEPTSGLLSLTAFSATLFSPFSLTLLCAVLAKLAYYPVPAPCACGFIRPALPYEPRLCRSVHELHGAKRVRVEDALVHAVRRTVHEQLTEMDGAALARVHAG